ncbi:hypothetical protein COV18_06925 [Candidatus Woesearchaeota archaeon CG10_big_fil_rev_8_21_14_0_10_37_12]|nr:MAG: hypothetical protein COV18_06925 [Candidatus Woesearchaeota archaeon CG10_big_fil_rev_8_21_14_0_10_37_12]
MKQKINLRFCPRTSKAHPELDIAHYRGHPDFLLHRGCIGRCDHCFRSDKIIAEVYDGKSTGLVYGKTKDEFLQYVLSRTGLDLNKFASEKLEKLKGIADVLEVILEVVKQKSYQKRVRVLSLAEWEYPILRYDVGEQNLEVITQESGGFRLEAEFRYRGGPDGAGYQLPIPEEELEWIAEQTRDDRFDYVIISHDHGSGLERAKAVDESMRKDKACITVSDTTGNRIEGPLYDRFCKPYKDLGYTKFESKITMQKRIEKDLRAFEV